MVCLFEGNSLRGFTDKHKPYQSFQNRMFFNPNLKIFILYLVHDSLLRQVLLRNPKRKLSSAKLVNRNTYTPHIASAYFFHFHSFQDLWSHVLRSSCKSDAFVDIDYLCRQAEISDFYLFVFNEDIRRFYITMHEVLRCEVMTRRYDLSRKIVNFFLISVKEMLLDVLFEVAFAVLKEKIKIIGSLFDI